jgi:hypothetical protein
MPLTETERAITRKVVANFIDEGRSTLRAELLCDFENPGALNRLDSLRILDVEDNRKMFLPTALAFHYCGDTKVRDAAISSLRTVIPGLAALLRVGNFDQNRSYTPQDLEGLLNHRSSASPQILLGLYLAREFGVLQGYSAPKLTEVETFQISEFEFVLGFGSVDQKWDEHVRQRSGNIVSPAPITGIPDVVGLKQISRKVFVVHGHDEEIKQSVARFLEKLDLEPIILHEQPNKGQTIIEKFEANSDVGFAVVLLAPDDEGKSAIGKDLKPRTRQNVILELGYFIGRLGRAKVCALYKDNVELPSDIHGVTYVSYDKVGAWRLELAREIKFAGLSVDMNLI